MRVVRKGPVKDLGLEDLFAFWSPAIQRMPPPLRTSFGNFTTLNSVHRFTLTTTATQAQYVWVDWVPTSLAALWMGAGSASGGFFQQHHYGTLASSNPTSIRPLRLGIRLENITQFTNVAGSVRVFSLDNPILAATRTDTVSGGPAILVSSPDNVFGTLIDNAPDTEEYPGAHFTSEQEFVSVPASYPAYNEYYTYVPFTNSTQSGALLQSGDLGSLVTGTPTPYVANTTYNAGTYSSAGLGGLPPLRGFLFEFPPAATAQTYRITIRRQDGARYAVNTLGATFAASHDKMSAGAEDCFINWAKQISPKPARCVPAGQVSAHASNGIGLQSSLAKLGNAVFDGVATAAMGMAGQYGSTMATRAFTAALGAM